MSSYRITRLAAAVSLSFCPLVTQAIGLGDVQSNSYLNRPLTLEFQILSNEPDLTPLKIELANYQTHHRFGIEYPRWLPKLSHKITERNGQFNLILTTNQPVKEPIVNFVLEMQFQGMSLYKEVTVLLDFPEQLNSVANKNLQSSKVSNVVSESESSKNLLAKVPSHSTGATYQISRGDSLWKLANNWRGTQLNQNQKMQAIFDANPTAFLNNNRNLLKQGSTIIFPTDLKSGMNKQSIQSTPKVAQLQVGQIKTALNKLDTTPGFETEMKSESTNRLSALETSTLRVNQTIQSLAEENRVLSEKLARIESILSRVNRASENRVSQSSLESNLENTSFSPQLVVRPSTQTDTTSEKGFFSEFVYQISLLGLLILLFISLSGRKLANRWRLNRFNSRLNKQYDHISFEDSRRFTDMPRVKELDIPQQSSNKSQVECIRSAAEFYLSCDRFDLAKELVNESLVQYASNSHLVERLLKLRKQIYIQIDHRLQNKIVQKLEHPVSRKQNNQDKIDLLYDEDKIALIDDEFGHLWNQKAS